MKVTKIEGASNGDFTITLESEHPAELALINLLDSCEAKCAKKKAEIPPEANSIGLVVPDPVLVITAEVKKRAREY